MSIRIPSPNSAFTNWKEYEYKLVKEKEKKRNSKRKYDDITPNQKEMFNSLVITVSDYDSDSDSSNYYINKESQISKIIVD